MLWAVRLRAHLVLGARNNHQTGGSPDLFGTQDNHQTGGSAHRVTIKSARCPDPPLEVEGVVCRCRAACRANLPPPRTWRAASRRPLADSPQGAAAR